MRRPLPSWKILLGKLGLQIVDKPASHSRMRHTQRQLTVESLERRDLMATLYWDTNGATPGLGGVGTWNTTAANWTTDATGSSATQAWNNAAGDDAVFMGTGAAVTIGSGIQASSLKVQSSGYTLGSGSLAVNGTGEVNVATTISTTISTQLTGSTELRKTGTGTLTLSGNNTFSGGSSLEAGTTIVSHNSALGSGTITLAGGKLQAGNGARTLSNAIVAAVATTSEVVSPTNNNLTLNGNLSGTGTIWKTGAFSVYLGGDNSGFAGTLSHRQSNFYFNTATAASAAATWDITGGNQFGANFAGDGTLRFGSLGGTTGAIHGGGSGGAKVWEIGALNTSTSYAGTIAGSTVSLVKLGTGTLTLGGSNTFTAGSTLSNGTLIVTNNSALGTGTITLAGGKLQSGSAARTLSNSIVAATGTVSELISPTNFNLTLNGNLTGSGTILKSGGYSVFLGGDNSVFAGAFSNRQSNVFLNTPNSASALASWDITGGDLLAMNFTGDGTVQLGSLAGTTGRIISGITNGTKTLEIGALNTTTTYNGTIQNHSTTTTATTVAVVKKGTGTLTLGGRNTFTNDLTIDAGTLVLANNNNDGTSKAGKGTITVRSGATLRVAGSNVFGTSANLPSEVALESGSTLDLIGAFYAQLPHVTLNGAAITSGAGNATYGSWAFMGGLSAAGMATSSITGQNMFIPGSVAMDVATGSALNVTGNFDKTSGYGDSDLNNTGGGDFTRFGNLVVNGSFEQPDVTAGTHRLYDSIPGWSLLNTGTKFEIQDNISGLGAAHDGQQHLELDSDNNSSDVQQTIKVKAGAVYSVSFWYRGRPNRPSDDNKLMFQLFDSNNGLIKQVDIDATVTNAWQQKTYEFTAPTNAVRLVFLDTGTPNSYGAFVDDVNLEFVAQGDLDIVNPLVEDAGEATTGGTIELGTVAKLLVHKLYKTANSTGDFQVTYDSDEIKLYTSPQLGNDNLYVSGTILTPEVDHDLWAVPQVVGTALVKLQLQGESSQDSVPIDEVKIITQPPYINIDIDSNNSGETTTDDNDVEDEDPGHIILLDSEELSPIELNNPFAGFDPYVELDDYNVRLVINGPIDVWQYADGTGSLDYVIWSREETIPTTLYVQALDVGAFSLTWELVCQPGSPKPEVQAAKDEVKGNVVDLQPVDDVFYFRSEDAVSTSEDDLIKKKQYDILLNDMMDFGNVPYQIELLGTNDQWGTEVTLKHGTASINNDIFEYKQTSNWTESEKIPYRFMANGKELGKSTAIITSGFKYTINSNGNMKNKDVVAERGLALIGGAGRPDNLYSWMYQKANGGDFIFLGSEYESGTVDESEIDASPLDNWENGNQIDTDLDSLAAQGTIDSVESLNFVYPNRFAINPNSIDPVTGDPTDFIVQDGLPVEYSDSDKAVRALCRSMSSDWFVKEKLNNSEAVFFDGGDQTSYRAAWMDTSVEEIIETKYASEKFVLGGTSAGLHILGGWDSYTGISGTKTDVDVVNGVPTKVVKPDYSILNSPNPIDNNVGGTSLVRYIDSMDWSWNSQNLQQITEFTATNFMNISTMSNILTESHFDVRKRMTRFVTFLANINIKTGMGGAEGIAISEGTGLLIDKTGKATVGGKGNVYFVRANDMPSLNQNDPSLSSVPLAIGGITVHRYDKNSPEFVLSNGWSYTANQPNNYKIEVGANVFGTNLPYGIWSDQVGNDPY